MFGDHGSGRIRTLPRTNEALLLLVGEIARVPRDHLLAMTQRKNGELLLLGRPSVSVSRLEGATAPGLAMPPIGGETVDERGADLIAEWICSLPAGHESDLEGSG